MENPSKISKQQVRRPRRTAPLLFALALSVALVAIAHAPAAIAQGAVFAPQDCPSLQDNAPKGRAFVRLPDTPAYSSDGANAAVIDWRPKPLEDVICHAGGQGQADGSRSRILIKSSLSGQCGWVDAAALVQQARKPQSQSGVAVGDVCHKITPMKADALQGLPDAGALDAKLLLWNINIDPKQSLSNDKKPAPEVPISKTPGGQSEGSVRIYNIFPVFDTVTTSGKSFHLIGGARESSNLLLGWVDDESGVIWDNRLSLFFKEGRGESYIFADKSAALSYTAGAEAKYLAKTPPNLAETFQSEINTSKYPILRRPDSSAAREIFEIAFIGSPPCPTGEACDPLSTSRTRQNLGEALDRLNDIDILFLIDATKSMSPYFGAVAEAVEENIKQFVDNPRIQIGVALYGDFKAKGRTGAGDALQFRWARPLSSMIEGNELKDLREEAIFLDDAQNDLPEGVFEALRLATKTQQWRNGTQRRLIHIGDHGDRGTTIPSDLLQALSDNSVFYFPVPVSGSYNSTHNANFYSIAKNIHAQHRTQPNGLPLGLKPEITYDPREASKIETDADRAADAASARKKISASLKAILSAANSIAEEIIRDVYGTTGQPTADPVPSFLPPGYSEMTTAIREVMGITREAYAALLKQGEIVAPGYALRKGLDGTDQWDYFVAMEAPVFTIMSASMGLLCEAASTSAAVPVLLEALKSQLQAGSGDEWRNDQSLNDYFRKSLSIPLSEETILSRPYDDLAHLLQSSSTPVEELVAFRKEICRSATLLSLAQNKQKLDEVEVGLDWVDGRWRIVGEARPFNWQVRNEIGLPLHYVPLAFFPGAQAAPPKP